VTEKKRASAFFRYSWFTLFTKENRFFRPITLFAEKKALQVTIFIKTGGNLVKMLNSPNFFR